MNVALWLTAARIVAIPVVMVLMLQEDSRTRWWAAGAYVAAAATDSLDGWWARSRGQVTVAGAFLDPLADKLLVTAALLCLVQTDDVPAWAVMVILTREFAVTGLRLLAVSEGLVIPAAGLGKAKTLTQNLAILLFTVDHPWKWVDWPVLWLALVLTILSGVYYFVMAKRRLLARKSPASQMSSDP